jgi:AcrR family transcriptional regulator
MITEMKTRKYTLKRRAERQEATRNRIVEATVRLHEALGPRATTVSAIATEAGVQRLTVYRHFPDPESLFRACSSHFLAGHPPPEPGEWSAIAAPGPRTRAALQALYGYYRATSRMWESVYRDLDGVPALRGPMDQVQRYLDGVRDDLLESWAPPPSVRGRVAVALGHAVRFGTWHSLALDGGEDPALATMMELWIRALVEEEAVASR